MNILALDPSSTAIGWAYHVKSSPPLAGGTLCESGVFRPPDVADRLDTTLTWLNDWFDAAISDCIPGVIAYEDSSAVMARNQMRGARQMENTALIRLVAGRHGVPLVRYAPNGIKKYATGNGHATKRQMVDACNRTFGLSLSEADHDQADAIWIMDMAINDVPGMDQNMAARKAKKKRAQSRKKKEPRLF